jgi:PCFT/HCP family folate transporter-like MFS transporter 1/3
MVRMMVESVFPALFNLVLGPFSDRFGRKPILNSTSIGLALYFSFICLWTILSNHYPISPWIYGLSILIYALSGGFYPMFAAMLSYTSDTSTVDSRSSRITIVELMITLGVLLGTFTSSYLVKIMTPLEIFLVALSCIGISAIYIVFFIKETIVVTEENRKLRGCVRIF